MQISDLIPELQPLATQVSTDLRYVCFFVLTASMVTRAARASRNIGGMMRPIVNAAILSGLIATLPDWFNVIRDEFWNMAMSIREEFASGVAPTGSALMQLVQPPEDGINWLDVTDSLAKAVQFGIGWLVVCLGGMIQLPMMIAQFIMECLCYMFLPIALSLLALESTRGLGIRYLQQTLAILAWPIGFAVVDLVGYAILTGPVSAGSALALGAGLATEFTPTSQILGCIVALWLILGSLGTPVVMQMLFCSGTPMSSSVGQALQLGLAAAGAARLGGGASSSAPGPSSSSSPSSGSGGGSSPSAPPPSSSPVPLLTGHGPRLGLTGAPRPAGLLPGGGSGIQPAQPSNPIARLPAGVQGVLQTPRGSLVMGATADRMTTAQAQAFANQSGAPVTQAFSNGAVMTHTPAVSRPAPSSFSHPSASSPATFSTPEQTAQAVLAASHLPQAIAY